MTNTTSVFKPNLNSVFAENRSDSQWDREQWATIHISGAINGWKVSFPIRANLGDDTNNVQLFLIRRSCF